MWFNCHSSHLVLDSCMLARVQRNSAVVGYLASDLCSTRLLTMFGFDFTLVLIDNPFHQWGAKLYGGLVLFVCRDERVVQKQLDF